jgi:hypothetical protein
MHVQTLYYVDHFSKKACRKRLATDTNASAINHSVKIVYKSIEFSESLGNQNCFKRDLRRSMETNFQYFR